MKILASPYRLAMRADYGTVGKVKEREGALLCVEFEPGVVGYCDCHPWPELGDLPLDEQLQAFKSGRPTSLGEHSLEMARVDADARKQKRSAFQGKRIPASYLLASLQEDPAPLLAEGFSCLKLKVGENPSKEVEAITRWIQMFPHLRLRFDFNERLSGEEFYRYIDRFDKIGTQWLDYAEDPFPYEPKSWQEAQKKLGISLAADRQAAQAMLHPESADVIVLKPAIQVIPDDLTSLKQLVITSYLDHPIGQFGAAYVASVLQERHPDKLGLCGLLTHRCYQANAFVEQVQSEGSYLQPVPGTGWGFDELLKRQTWKPL